MAPGRNVKRLRAQTLIEGDGGVHQCKVVSYGSLPKCQTAMLKNPDRLRWRDTPTKVASCRSIAETYTTPLTMMRECGGGIGQQRWRLL